MNASDPIARAASPSCTHTPEHLWSLLRDQARQDLAAELATATLEHYEAAAVTDAIVADLLARGQDAALHERSCITARDL